MLTINQHLKIKYDSGRDPQQARSPENRPRSRSSDHRPRDTAAAPRSPDSYKPRSPDAHPPQHFFPSENNNGGPRSPNGPGGPRSPPIGGEYQQQGHRSPVTGVLSLKDYLEYGSILDRGLDFENTLLNLVVVSAVLVFVLITYIVVSARGSAAYTNRYGMYVDVIQHSDMSQLSTLVHDSLSDGSRVTESKVQADGKSSLKSKQVSNDTAYSDFSSGGPRRSQSQQRSRSGGEDNSQGGPRRSSGNRQSQRSHNGPPPTSGRDPQQARSPENRPKSRSSDHRPRDTAAVPRSPDSYKPRSPDPHPPQHFFPSENNGGPRSPNGPGGPRSPPIGGEYQQQGHRSPPPASDHSYQMAYHDNTAPPPPLFEGGLRQSQRGSRGPPPPIATNPPASQPVGVVSPFPSQYEGQSLLVDTKWSGEIVSWYHYQERLLPNLNKLTRPFPSLVSHCGRASNLNKLTTPEEIIEPPLKPQRPPNNYQPQPTNYQPQPSATANQLPTTSCQLQSTS
eukprot:sb/3463986/